MRRKLFIKLKSLRLFNNHCSYKVATLHQFIFNSFERNQINEVPLENKTAFPPIITRSSLIHILDPRPLMTFDKLTILFYSFFLPNKE